MLAIPRSQGKFVLDTDASDLAIGGELSQIQDGQERTIAYASAVLNAVIARKGDTFGCKVHTTVPSLSLRATFYGDNRPP